MSNNRLRIYLPGHIYHYIITEPHPKGVTMDGVEAGQIVYIDPKWFIMPILEPFNSIDPPIERVEPDDL